MCEHGLIGTCAECDAPPPRPDYKKRSGYPKLMNEYALAVGDRLYHDIPKAVWAALAVSALTQGGDYLAEARERVLAEWLVLHQNGIVPQSPIREEEDETLQDA